MAGGEGTGQPAAGTPPIRYREYAVDMDNMKGSSFSHWLVNIYVTHGYLWAVRSFAASFAAISAGGATDRNGKPFCVR